MSKKEEREKQTGKVYLVGAGPSDVELLTIKGARLLQKADVIVYDRLAGTGVLIYGNPEAEYIDVGKQAGYHPIPQQEINQILRRKAEEGKMVVRLKGGDPFVFGRGAEEAEELFRDNIPFEVVPGITSAISVPAYQGIPVTHRDMASSVHIITAHKKDGGMPEGQYQILAKTEGTLVFLMGVTALPDLMEGLMRAGMDPMRPAAVLERGTTARQRKIAGTVGTLAKQAKESGIRPPAIILVGEAAGITGLEWYEKRPLAGTKILITRPRERSGRLAGMLRDKGAEVLEVPAIRTVPCEDQSRLLQALKRLEQYQWMVFTSPAGAELVLRLMREQHMDIRKLSGLRIACIGKGTAEILESRGVFADLIPQVYDGRHLGRELGVLLKTGEQVLLPRAANGNPELLSELRNAYSGEGMPLIDEISIYDTVPEKLPYIDYASELKPGNTDYVMFTSASTVHGFVRAAEGADMSGVKALCIGKQTEAAAKQYGMKTAVAREATLQAMVELAENINRESVWE